MRRKMQNISTFSIHRILLKRFTAARLRGTPKIPACVRDSLLFRLERLSFGSRTLSAGRRLVVVRKDVRFATSIATAPVIPISSRCLASPLFRDQLFEGGTHAHQCDDSLRGTAQLIQGKASYSRHVISPERGIEAAGHITEKSP